MEPGGGVGKRGCGFWTWVPLQLPISGIALGHFDTDPPKWKKKYCFYFQATTCSLLSLIPFHLNSPQLQYSIWKRRRLSVALRTALTQYLVSNEQSWEHNIRLKINIWVDNLVRWFKQKCLEAWEISQLAECLPRKHENRGSVPRTQVKC